MEPLFSNTPDILPLKHCCWCLWCQQICRAGNGVHDKGDSSSVTLCNQAERQHRRLQSIVQSLQLSNDVTPSHWQNDRFKKDSHNISKHATCNSSVVVAAVVVVVVVVTRKSCTGKCCPVRSIGLRANAPIVVDAALRRIGKSRHGGHKIANISLSCQRI